MTESASLNGGNPVTTEAELNAAIAAANSAGSGALEIDLANDVALSSALTHVSLQPGVTLTIDGDGHTLDGQGAQQGLYAYSGQLTVQDLTLSGMLAQGTDGVDGGGGGAGLGGGLFVAGTGGGGASVVLRNVDFVSDAAQGGNGGNGDLDGADGQDGYGLGGQGGFGSGPGALGDHRVGSGGGGGGGGGLGAGGDIFVQQGGSLTIEGGSLGTGTVGFGGGGDSNGGMGTPGDAFGDGIFIQGDQTLRLGAASGQVLTVSGAIADQTGSGDPAAGAGVLKIGGEGETGTVVLAAADGYAGGTVIEAGTLELAAIGAAGTGDITFAPGAHATLRIDDVPANTIAGFAGGDAIDLAGFGDGVSATLGDGDVLTITGHSIQAQLQLSGDYAGQHFGLAPDGNGGTLVLLNPPPTVTSDTAQAAGSALAAGQSVTFAVATSAPVTVTGTPALTLSNGGTATYAGTDPDGALLFSYAAGADDTGTNDLQVTGLSLDGGSIADAYGVALDASALGTLAGSDTGLAVDTGGPGGIDFRNYVTNAVGIALVSPNPDGTYAVTDNFGTSSTLNGTVRAAGDGFTFTFYGTTYAATVVQTSSGYVVGELSGSAAAYFGSQYIAFSRSVMSFDTPVPASSTVGGFFLPPPPQVEALLADSGVTRAGVTYANSPALFGTAEPGGTVTISNGGVTLGATGTDAQGNWAFTPVLPDGRYDLTVSETGAGGTGSTDVAFALDTVAPAFTGVSVAADRPGTSFGAGTQLTFTVGLSEYDLTGSLHSLNGPVPFLVLNDGFGLALLTGASRDGLVFSYTVPEGVNVADLKVIGADLNGTTLTDYAGNPIPQAQLDDPSGVPGTDTGLSLDTTAPAAPAAIALDPASGGAGTATTATPTIDGTAEAGSTVTLLDGTTVLGSATADAAGGWSVASIALANGSHVLTATATDAAGNVSAPSASFALAVDVTAPSPDPGPQPIPPPVLTPIPVPPPPPAPGNMPTTLAVTASLADDTGVSATDGITNDGSLAGTAAAGSTVTVLDGTAVLATATADAGGAWSIAGSRLGLADGSYGLTVSDADGQGDSGTATIGLTLDTVAPAVGLAASRILADSATPVITGTAEAGASVAVSIDGTVLGTATADAATGAWSYGVTAVLTQGAHQVTAQATDPAGNVSAATPASGLFVSSDLAGGTSTAVNADTAPLVLYNQLAGATPQFVSGTEAIQLSDGTLSVGPDTQQAFVARLYQGVLGRADDLGGMGYWNDQISHGASLSDVATGFLGSAEGQAATAGLTNQQYVDALYQGLLDRSGGSGETSYWTGLLANGASRGQVLAGIADSSESRTALAPQTGAVFAPDLNAELVVFNYETAFGRAPDASGFDYWTGLLNNGLGVSDFETAFTATPEFQAAHGGETADQLVASLYQNGLGRAASGAEISAYGGGTQTSGSLLAMVAQSQEALGNLQAKL